MSSNAAVFTELFDLNFRDELGPEATMSAAEVHAAFVRALHVTVCDMPLLDAAEPEPTAAAAAAVPAKPRRRIVTYLGITAKAALVAGLIRLTIFFGTGF